MSHVFRGKGDKRSQAFRHSYSKIGHFRTYHPSVAFVAMTATATSEVLTSVTDSLQMPTYQCVRASPERQNIRYVYVTVLYMYQDKQNGR